MFGRTVRGKRTALYALLKALSSQEKNILTIEILVEYYIKGITQVSLKPEHRLGFTETLRAALRQDSDFILISEIRVEETASVELKASLTVTLVLSTLHSNCAVTSIQRLLNLGISQDLLVEILTVIISQRMVRLHCYRNPAKKPLT